jgi:UDP-glucose 4-epimerase
MTAPEPAVSVGQACPFRLALVTGAAGFLGSALTRRLTADGATVVGIDQRDPGGGDAGARRFHRADLLERRELVALVAGAVGGAGGDCVAFHLAGESHVGVCSRDPLRAYALNVTATINLLEACRAAGVTRVVLPSTALVYRAPRGLPASEDAPVAPATIYAATKLAAERLLEGYAAEYRFSCRVARLGNVYGAGGHADSVVSILLRQALRGGPLEVGRLSPQRDFVFRDDVAGGLAAIAAADFEPGFRIFNLSSGEATAIGDLALAVCRAAGLPPGVTERDPPGSGSEDRLVLSIRRITEDLHWRPAWALEAGLRQTLAEMRREEHG